jgi:hypothetical protein
VHITARQQDISVGDRSIVDQNLKRIERPLVSITSLSARG